MDWSPAVEDGASPPPFFVSAMIKSVRANRVKSKDGPKDSEVGFQGFQGQARAVARVVVERKPVRGGYQRSMGLPMGAFTRTWCVEGQM